MSYQQQQKTQQPASDAHLALKPSELRALLAVAIPNRMPVLIKGAPGVGKTDIVKAAAADAGYDLLIEHPAVADPTDPKGVPIPVDGRVILVAFGQMEKVLAASRPTVLFLDDLGQAPPAVQAAYMQVLLAREIAGHKIPDCVTFVAATNRKGDRAGVSGILEPVKSRFCTIVEVKVDAQEWAEWATRNGVHPVMVGFIRFRPELLHQFVPTMDLTQSPSPRGVVQASRWIDKGLSTVVEFAAIAGACGEAFAIEFTAFASIWRGLPDVQTVLLHPDTADVPTDPATCYAVCAALARAATPANAKALVTYADRFATREFGVLLVTDARCVCPEVENTAAYVAWATNPLNAAVL